MHGFSATFNSAGAQRLSLRDVVNSSIIGADNDIPVEFNIPTVEGFLVTGNNKLYEYSTQGTLLQTLAIPNPNGYTPQGEYVRAVGVDWHDTFHAFNGTFQPLLSVYFGNIEGWKTYAADGWSISNTTSNGSVAFYGPYIYVPDENNGGGVPNGIVRFNHTNGSFDTLTRFGDGNDYVKLTVGQDGRLYALRDGGTVSRIDVYEPVSGEFIRTITLSTQDQ